jgi:serine/threonine protein kinase
VRCRATDTNLKRTVAIKVLPEAVATDGERLARFQREAEVLARLNHPNIASIYGLEKSDGTAALVMELVEGRRWRIASRRGRFRSMTRCRSRSRSPSAGSGARTGHHPSGSQWRTWVRSDGTVKVLDFDWRRPRSSRWFVGE